MFTLAMLNILDALYATAATKERCHSKTPQLISSRSVADSVEASENARPENAGLENDGPC